MAGVLSQPVFSPEHHLILPEGTRLTGRVTLARRARLFHRGGQLRFAFDEIQPPLLLDAPAPQKERASAQLTVAEPSSGSLQVDGEGTAKAKG
jgi:hypothetical protein